MYLAVIYSDSNINLGMNDKRGNVNM